MTKNEAIKFIKECAKDSDAPYGFFVCVISREDLANHFDNEMVDKFDKLSKKKKEIVLSNIADEIKDIFEENEFGVDLENVEIDFEM